MSQLPLGLFAATRAIAQGTLTPQDYVRQCDARANEVEPWLHAFVSRTPLEQLLQQTDGGEWAGIPVGVKDLVATQDLPTTNGSPIYADQMLDYDAPIVTKIRQLGGLVFGKTVTTEFAFRQPGPTVNFWNRAHSPGGSSSGSAAAVAAGVVPLALGTQTVGSVIRPAAYCGVVGLKASFGAMPRSGVFPLSGSLDHVGLMARSVNDVAYAFNSLRNRSILEPDAIVLPSVPMDAQTGLAPTQAPRLAWLKTPFDHLISAEQTKAMADAVAVMRQNGAVVEEFSLPDNYWQGMDMLQCLLECDASAIHDEHEKNHAALLGESITDLVHKGRKRTAIEYLHVRTAQRALRHDAINQFKGFDAVLTVPATGEAPEGLHYTGDASFCALWSFLGLPAITLPIARSAKGLPLGLQLVAGYKQDAHLMRVACWAELTLPSAQA